MHRCSRYLFPLCRSPLDPQLHAARCNSRDFLFGLLISLVFLYALLHRNLGSENNWFGNEEAISNSQKGYGVVSQGLWGGCVCPVNAMRALSGFMERVFITLPLLISVNRDFCLWNKHKTKSKVQKEMLISYHFGWIFCWEISVAFFLAPPMWIFEIRICVFSGKYSHFSLFCPSHHSVYRTSLPSSIFRLNNKQGGQTYNFLPTEQGPPEETNAGHHEPRDVPMSLCPPKPAASALCP